MYSYSRYTINLQNLETAEAVEMAWLSHSHSTTINCGVVLNVTSISMEMYIKIRSGIRGFLTPITYFFLCQLTFYHVKGSSSSFKEEKCKIFVKTCTILNLEIPVYREITCGSAHDYSHSQESEAERYQHITRWANRQKFQILRHPSGSPEIEQV